MWRRLFCAFALSFCLLSVANTAEALPDNFRNVDIFYVGAMPSNHDIDDLSALGIQHIISLHKMPSDVSRRARKKGIEVHEYPWHAELDKVEQIMTILEQAPPNTVFLHCMHGADRTGAATAYWLHTRRGYDPFLALAAVISPRSFHLKGLEQLAHEYSYNLAEVDKLMFGRFSGARNGGLEGLKLRSGRWYTALARNYLERTIGPPLHEPSKRFWRYKD